MNGFLRKQFMADWKVKKKRGFVWYVFCFSTSNYTNLNTRHKEEEIKKGFKGTRFRNQENSAEGRGGSGYKLSCKYKTESNKNDGNKDKKKIDKW